MPSFEIKQGDTGPPFVGKCLDAKGQPVPTTGATVRFRMRPKVAGLRASIDAAATWLDAATAEAEYQWILADTATPGLYDAEFHVTFGDGTQETFPNGEYVTVEILPRS